MIHQHVVHEYHDEHMVLSFNFTRFYTVYGLYYTSNWLTPQTLKVELKLAYTLLTCVSTTVT